MIGILFFNFASCEPLSRGSLLAEGVYRLKIIQVWTIWAIGKRVNIIKLIEKQHLINDWQNNALIAQPNENDCPKFYTQTTHPLLPIPSHPIPSYPIPSPHISQNHTPLPPLNYSTMFHVILICVCCYNSKQYRIILRKIAYCTLHSDCLIRSMEGEVSVQ